MARYSPAQQLANVRLWLAPGMGVKRHVGLAILGTLVLSLGVVGTALWALQESRQILTEPIEQVLVSRAWQQYGLWLSLAVLVAGFATAALAITRLNRSLLSNWLEHPEAAAPLLYERLALSKGPRIVAMGGGSGLSNLLRGLRHHTSNITAVVTVADDGGSSGRLRHAFDMPAPGDLNDCLAALADNESELTGLLEYRFKRGGELTGHTFGNLLITTLMEAKGDFAQAIRVLNSVLSIRGSVYPVAAEPLSLEVVKQSGERVEGESNVRERPGAIHTVMIHPQQPQALPEVVQAIYKADLVVLGPGSLFTSTLPPTLLPDIKRALLRTGAELVYVCNIMTEAGETDGFAAWDHVETLQRHIGRYPDWAICNKSVVDAGRLARYREEGADIVTIDKEVFEEHGIPLAELELLGPGPHAQHDADVLARWLVRHAKQERLTPWLVEV